MAGTVPNPTAIGLTASPPRRTNAHPLKQVRDVLSIHRMQPYEAYLPMMRGGSYHGFSIHRRQGQAATPLGLFGARPG